MGLAVIILPDDAELNHTLRDLDDIKSLLILGVRLEERLKRLSELVESLEISPLRQGILIVISEKAPRTCSNSGSTGRTIVIAVKEVLRAGKGS